MSCFNLHNPHVRTTRRTHPGVEAINPRPINRRGIAFSNTLHCRACSVFFISFSLFLFLKAEKSWSWKDIDLDFNLFNLSKSIKFFKFFLERWFEYRTIRYTKKIKNIDPLFALTCYVILRNNVVRWNCNRIPSWGYSVAWAWHTIATGGSHSQPVAPTLFQKYVEPYRENICAPIKNWIRE